VDYLILLTVGFLTTEAQNKNRNTTPEGKNQSELKLKVVFQQVNKQKEITTKCKVVAKLWIVQIKANQTVKQLCEPSLHSAVASRSASTV
jgi:LysM repeat protein